MLYIRDQSVSGHIFDIWRLEKTDVSVVRPDHIPHVDVDCHPGPIAKGHENHFKVDVIAEDQPKAKRCLEGKMEIRHVRNLGYLIFLFEMLKEMKLTHWYNC